MSDPAIKLFGKTIALPSADELKSYATKEIIAETKDTNDEESLNQNSEEKVDQTVINSATDHDNSQNSPEKDSKSVEEEQNDSNNQQEKPALKKPDKILPCPRCNSMDTKFCYYNNYNVNQPRHFCKNCQRYWTAGGTMRNVPVGAGRRKNKNTAAAAAHFRHLTMTDAAMQAIPDTISHHHGLKPNGTVLSFGSDAPLCESMTSVLNIAEKNTKNCNRNGFTRVEEQKEEQSTGSSNCSEVNMQEPAIAPVPCFINGSLPWPYQSFPIPIYPAAAYWGCSSWSVPWIAPMASPSPTSGSSGSGSPNSPTLGKHSRDGNILQRNNSSSSPDCVKLNNNLWMPKTLRIDDPEEAAKSSIWTSIGFKNDKDNEIGSRGGLFKSFQTKAELNGGRKVEASNVLHANPAAMSRSLNFQEST